MKFSILLFIIFGIKVRICDAVIYTLEIGDPITCGCLTYYYAKISWTLQKVNGEKIPLITNCPYPYNDCTVQNYKGNIFLEVNNTVNKLTVHHVVQDMFRLICSPDYFREYTDNCILNVLDSFGASPIGSPIHTLNQGGKFTSECNLIGSLSLEWTLQKVNGETIILVPECYEPYTSCAIGYNTTNFKIVTEDKNAYMQMYSSIPPMYVSKLTVLNVDKDMLRVFCSSDGFGNGRDRCLMSVVDYVRPDNGIRKSTPTYSAICLSRMPSTTPSPDVYLTTYPTRSFLRTTPKPATEKPINLALVICVTALPVIGAVVIPTLCCCCCCYCKNRKGLQRQNEAMCDISNTPQLTPATVPGPDENDLCSTHVNPLVHPSNNTATNQSPQHTTSIQSTAPNDSPPPYSSLLELRVEPPPYTTLTAESYNHVSAPSQQAENVPPPYSTRYNCVSPASNLHAPNEPPPYSTRYNCVSPASNLQAPNEPPPYSTRYTAQQQAPNEPPPSYSVWHTS